MLMHLFAESEKPKTFECANKLCKDEGGIQQFNPNNTTSTLLTRLHQNYITSPETLISVDFKRFES
jgi:hypothetical protein